MLFVALQLFSGPVRAVTLQLQPEPIPERLWEVCCSPALVLSSGSLWVPLVEPSPGTLSANSSMKM